MENLKPYLNRQKNICRVGHQLMKSVEAKLIGKKLETLLVFRRHLNVSWCYWTLFTYFLFFKNCRLSSFKRLVQEISITSPISQNRPVERRVRKWNGSEVVSLHAISGLIAKCMGFCAPYICTSTSIRVCSRGMSSFRSARKAPGN